MPRLQRLWYDLELNTKDFEQGLQRAGVPAQRFLGLLKDHRVAAGAAAAALILVGAAATKMAAELDGGLRRAQGLMPALTGQIGTVRKELIGLSVQTGRSVTELVQAFQAIVEAGVSGPEEALQRLRVSLLGADAASQDLTATAQGLDQVMDAFGIAGGRAGDVMARLFTTAQGRVPLDELFAALATGGATLQTLNVSLEEATGAIAALVDAGVPGTRAAKDFVATLETVTGASEDQRKVAQALGIEFSATALQTKGLAQFFRELVEQTRGSEAQLRALGFTTKQVTVVQQLGAVEGRAFAQSQRSAADAMRELERAALTNRASAERLAGMIRAQLNAVLLDLGNTILPGVLFGLQTLDGLLLHLTGRVRELNFDPAVRTIQTLARHLGNLSNESAIRDLGRVKVALQELVGPLRADSPLLGAQQAAVDVANAVQAFGALNREQQQAVLTAVELLARFEQIPAAAATALRAAATAQGVTLPDLTRPRPGTGAGAGADAAREALTAEILTRRAELVQQAQQTLADHTTTLVDNAQRAFDEFFREVEQGWQGVPPPPEVQQALDALREQVRGLGITEPLARGLKEALSVLDDVHFDEAAFAAAGDQLQQLEAQALATRDAFAEGTVPWQQIQDFIEEVRGAQRRLSEEYLAQKDREADKDLEAQRARARAAAQEKAAREKAVRDAIELGRQIESAARGALQLAAAFGLVNNETAAMLEDLVQIGAAIPGALAGDPASIVALAGGVASVLGGLFGGGGERERLEAEQRTRDRQEQQALAEAEAMLRQLEESQRLADELFALRKQLEQTGLGVLGLDVAGRDIDALRRGVEFGIASIPEMRRKLPLKQSDLDLILATSGLSMEEFRFLAEQAGVTFAGLIPTMEELNRLLEILNQEFLASFRGQLSLLRNEFELFDITDPIEQLQRLAAVFSSPEFGAPALRAALAGLDLSTPEGRAAAERAIQELFRRLQAGELDPAELGGLTGAEFLAALLEMEGLIDTIAQQQTASGQSVGFQVQRTITETTGNRMVGVLSSILLRLTELVQLVESLVDEVAGRDDLARPRDPEGGPTTIGLLAEMNASMTEMVRSMQRVEGLLESLLRLAEPGEVEPPAVTPTDLEQLMRRGLFATSDACARTVHVTVNLGSLPAGMPPREAGQEIGLAIADILRDVDRALGERTRRSRLAQGTAVFN